MKLQVRVEQAIAAAEKKGRELPGQPEHGQGERSCDNCGNPKCGPALICKSSTREHWQPIPAKVDNMCNDDCAACKTEPCPITVSRIDDNNLAKLLADCAECLDDCLVRMYPDEFDRDTVTDADKRFFEHNGGIARVTDLFERIKRYVPAKVDGKNVCAMIKAVPLERI